MHCRKVHNHLGKPFQLSEEEEKYVRSLERLSKMPMGRLMLFANGTISIRICGNWHDDNIDGSCNIQIPCDGGDGGD